MKDSCLGGSRQSPDAAQLTSKATMSQTKAVLVNHTAKTSTTSILPGAKPHLVEKCVYVLFNNDQQRLIEKYLTICAVLNSLSLAPAHSAVRRTSLLLPQGKRCNGALHSTHSMEQAMDPTWPN
jgi:hypothetical protein